MKLSALSKAFMLACAVSAAACGPKKEAAKPLDFNMGGEFLLPPPTELTPDQKKLAERYVSLQNRYIKLKGQLAAVEDGINFAEPLKDEKAFRPSRTYFIGQIEQQQKNVTATLTELGEFQKKNKVRLARVDYSILSPCVRLENLAAHQPVDIAAFLKMAHPEGRIDILKDRDSINESLYKLEDIFNSTQFSDVSDSAEQMNRFEESLSHFEIRIKAFRDKVKISLPDLEWQTSLLRGKMIQVELIQGECNRAIRYFKSAIEGPTLNHN